jgi:7,8-dihydropterin-6-yl-methyl-4-(beta-D-ribofuranosyl)aminobenzene 5'-phosphate synthase
VSNRTRDQFLVLAWTLAFFPSLAFADPAMPNLVRSLQITVLSTNLAERGMGEWGFAALVEADGQRILFDTGARPDTVWQNAQSLDVDLSDVRDVVLSHHHGDHSSGLVFLRTKYFERHSKGISQLHVGHGIFWDRAYRPPGWTHMRIIREEFEQQGGSVKEYDSPAEIFPGVWLTGPVPRVHPEKNYGNPYRPDEPPRKSLSSPDGLVIDDVPESLSMVVNTSKGLVVISGCGHAGMINILEYATQLAGTPKIHAAIGGFHLLNADDELIDWTAGKLQRLELGNFIGAHCTGIEPVYRFRDVLDLGRKNSVVGAVGATFSLDQGINPLRLAH